MRTEVGKSGGNVSTVLLVMISRVGSCCLACCWTIGTVGNHPRGPAVVLKMQWHPCTHDCVQMQFAISRVYAGVQLCHEQHCRSTDD